MDCLCFDLMFGPVNRITTGSLKEQKNETVQKYKPKVPNKKKCHRQVKLNVSRVLVGCWWGCSGVFAFIYWEEINGCRNLDEVNPASQLLLLALL